MSKKNRRTNRQVIEKEQKTSTGIWCTGGEIQANDNDNVEWEDLRKDYSSMMKDTPALSSSFFLLCAPIQSSKPRIDPGLSKSDLAKEAASYINNCWNSLEKGFSYKLKHDLQAVINGCAFSEKIPLLGDEYEILQNGKYLKKLTNRIIYYSPIQNETINKFYLDDNSKFIGMRHEKRIPEKGSNFIDIKEGLDGIKDINEVLSWYTFNELYNDVRGNSILRPARFYWECLRKIIIGRTVNIQAGHGLVGIATQGEPSSADKTKLANMAKAINALHGDNYYIYDKTKIDVILNELKGQQEIMVFIEFLWKQILISFLTQFISIGMGQVGAFNAGETQKSPYELAINNLAEDLKRYYQTETEYMISISYLSGLAKEDIPIFEFDMQQQSDLLKTSQIILNFKNAGINFTEEEIDRIKSLLSILPEKSIQIEDQKTIATEEDTQAKENIEMSAKIKTRNIKPEILEFEAKVFDSGSVENHYLTVEEKADNTIKEILLKILNDVKGQLKAGRKIDVRYGKELESKLLKLFNESYNKGEYDIHSEIKKVKTFKQLKLKDISIELAASKKTTDKQSKVISLTVDRLLQSINNKVNYDMAKMDDKQLSNIGGIDGYIDNLSSSFDGIKRDLINDTTSGYTLGRNETIDNVTVDDTIFLYSGILDKNFCNECSREDGLEFTKQEIQNSSFLTLTGNSINLNCKGLLGKNKCRCQWIISG